jgi:hypothetical protein
MLSFSRKEKKEKGKERRMKRRERRDSLERMLEYDIFSELY